MKQFTVLPLGTGNFLSKDKGNFHSNFMVEYGEDRLFVDCGSDFQYALKAAKIDYKEVKHLYISHVHWDHAGGLLWLANMNESVRQKSLAKKPLETKPPATTLYVPQEIIGDINKMIKPSIEASTKNALIDGIKACFTLVTPYVKEKQHFEIGILRCTPVELVHVNTYAKLNSYALKIEAFSDERNKKLFISTDVQFQSEVMMPYYEWADVILHDCSTDKELLPDHAHFTQLATLPVEIKKKMYLYHYGVGKKPDADYFGFKGYALPREPIII